jgi:Holliday junction resolvase-like predicted endonuclease
VTENDVIGAVCVYLERSGYEIVQRLHTSQRGVDVIARRSRGEARLLHIEAKSATSAREGSRKFGVPYGPAEVRINVAEAVYTAAVGTKRDAPTRWAIAFSDDMFHRRYVEPIRPALMTLDIGVFWVQETQAVFLEASWDL